MIDNRIKEARERSAAAETAFRRKSKELEQTIGGSMSKSSVLEVGNGSSLLASNCTHLFDHRKVEPSEAPDAADKLNPDIIVIDGDDLESIAALCDMGKLRAAKVVVVSRDVLDRCVAYAKDYLRQVIVKPVDPYELADLLGCLKPER